MNESRFYKRQDIISETFIESKPEKDMVVMCFMPEKSNSVVFLCKVEWNVAEIRTKVYIKICINQ